MPSDSSFKLPLDAIALFAAPLSWELLSHLEPFARSVAHILGEGNMYVRRSYLNNPIPRISTFLGQVDGVFFKGYTCTLIGVFERSDVPWIYIRLPRDTNRQVLHMIGKSNKIDKSKMAGLNCGRCTGTLRRVSTNASPGQVPL